ncbi:MAG: hypothetical protein Faunusvirus19_5 [Faunusvirus sp.]|jgi:hypothetical protein|uniref:Uncharacterized protein n=1 Tax=Faunusvirus sp. TaxID=2487766 RepID=A0A3G4ZX88_9VIRU|nr:MAG: hypothetical protein Faunusvirus19_5 [Faunusvirus sp.]
MDLLHNRLAYIYKNNLHIYDNITHAVTKYDACTATSFHPISHNEVILYETRNLLTTYYDKSRKINKINLDTDKIVGAIDVGPILQGMIYTTHDDLLKLIIISHPIQCIYIINVKTMLIDITIPFKNVLSICSVIGNDNGIIVMNRQRNDINVAFYNIDYTNKTVNQLPNQLYKCNSNAIKMNLCNTYHHIFDNTYLVLAATPYFTSCIINFKDKTIKFIDTPITAHRVDDKNLLLYCRQGIYKYDGATGELAIDKYCFTPDYSHAVMLTPDDIIGVNNYGVHHVNIGLSSIQYLCTFGYKPVVWIN